MWCAVAMSEEDVRRAAVTFTCDSAVCLRPDRRSGVTFLDDLRCSSGTCGEERGPAERRGESLDDGSSRVCRATAPRAVCMLSGWFLFC